jgi:competence protein ComEC
LKRGDTVRIEGRLKEGFATYQGVITYATLLDVKRHPDLIRDIRERFVESIRSFVAEPMASLGVGFVVGQRSALPPDLDEQLKIVGLTHIVVASGYNLTILVRFARRLLARHSRYLALIASLALMLSFVAFSGMSPSMNRAVAVTGLSLLAWYYGRRFHPLLLIGYVAAATAYWNPVYVWEDLGWYLSFFAFGGVLILAPLIASVLYREQKPPALAQLVLETLSAELMTLPLIALAFEVFPSFGMLANVLVGPLIPFAMLATTIAGLAGMLFPVVAPILALPVTVIIGCIVMIVETLSAIEWAQLAASVTLPIVVVWFCALITSAILVWQRTNYDFRSSSIVD